MVKVGLIGSGNIGGALATMILDKQLGEVALYDKEPGLAEGKALDLAQSFAAEEMSLRIEGSNNFEVLKGSDVLVVTAGFPRGPGMSRQDLLLKNIEVYKEIGPLIVRYAPQAFVIVVTNPLDLMVWAMQKITGFPHARVVGMAGILDTARFATFIAEALEVSSFDVKTLVLGGHGDLMVPLVRHTHIGGVPLETLWKRRNKTVAELEALIERTRNGGAEIVGLLKRGSAYMAPARACFYMIKAYLRDEKRLLPCSAFIDGLYDERALYMGVPVVLGRYGVEEIVEIDLDEKEREAFRASASDIWVHLKELEHLHF